MLDVKPLRYFVTLAETRHFGRAAARLNLLQPSLSRQLAALEATLGVMLVKRSPRSGRLPKLEAGEDAVTSRSRKEVWYPAFASTAERGKGNAPNNTVFLYICDVLGFRADVRMRT